LITHKKFGSAGQIMAWGYIKQWATKNLGEIAAIKPLFDDIGIKDIVDKDCTME